ncbi:MAG: DUF4435 domain-containing protein [Dysgonamonadaceae bacterium]|jgi:hypothetical protein|nr:DUF4435 domain-containing protein [Dysgonamonadaceae bacterium]
MAAITTVYCEGKRGSHDFDILDRIIGDKVAIKPIGGKKGAGAIIEFIEKGGATRSDFYLFFRDRDFDRRVPEREELIFDGKKTYFSYRTTIENYLFDTGLFFKFIEEKKSKDKYKIFSEDDVKRVFIKAARKIKDYQAIRHSLGKMRSGDATFNTTWISGGSGDLPENLSLADCKKNGWNLIQKAQKIVSEWTEEKYDSILNEFLTLFDEQFLADLKFLIYFQGKDFAQALQLILKDFPIRDYYRFSKENLDFTKFNDLGELQQIVNSRSHKKP